jgi:hypothetical protein
MWLHIEFVDERRVRLQCQPQDTILQLKVQANEHYETMEPLERQKLVREDGVALEETSTIVNSQLMGNMTVYLVRVDLDWHGHQQVKAERNQAAKRIQGHWMTQKRAHRCNEEHAAAAAIQANYRGNISRQAEWLEDRCGSPSPPPGRGEDEDFQPGASPRKHRLVEHKGAAAAALQLAAGGKSRGARAALSAKASLSGKASLKGGRGGQQPRPPGTPAHLPGDTDILPQPPAAAAIAVGHSHCLLVSTAGLPFACGGGLYGRLGLGHVRDTVRFTQLPTPPRQRHVIRIEKVAAGRYHSVFLEAGGAVLTCGSGEDGQVGGMLHSATVSCPALFYYHYCHCHYVLILNEILNVAEPAYRCGSWATATPPRA